MQRSIRAAWIIGFRGALVAFVTCAVGVSARAETWLVDTGDGDWNTNTNWNPNSVPNAIGAAAIFNTPTGNRTISLNGNSIIVGSITIDNSSGFTNAIRNNATNDGPSTLTFDAAGAGPAVITSSNVLGTGGTNANTISATMIWNDTVRADVTNLVGNAAGALSLTGAITGPGGFIKDGGGTVTMAFVVGLQNIFKDYTGPTVVNAGRLRTSSGGTPRFTSSVTVNSGGQLVFTGASATFSYGSMLATLPTVTLKGNGRSDFPGAIRVDVANATIPNPIVLDADASINVPGSASGLTLPGGISGPGKFTLGYLPGDPTNQGILTLTGTNIYTGGTNVVQGTLALSGAGVSLGTGSVTVDGVSTGDNGSIALGKLVLPGDATNAIADSATLSLTGGWSAGVADGGSIELGGGLNEVVGGLVLGGVAKPAGVYGSTGSSAPPANQFDEYFAGSGTITVAPSFLAADFNNSGAVDGTDFNLWTGGFGSATGQAKINGDSDGDGDVDGVDFLKWQQQFGGTSPAVANVAQAPEPAAALLLVIGAMAWIGARRHW